MKITVSDDRTEFCIDENHLGQWTWSFWMDGQCITDSDRFFDTMDAARADAQIHCDRLTNKIANDPEYAENVTAQEKHNAMLCNARYLN